jgi:hypothetical protein
LKRRIFGLRACLNFILRFCYAPFFTAFCYKNAHLALPNSAFEAATGKKIAYNKFQKQNLNRL